MKIFYDHQTFSLQEYGGISRYYAELIKGINSRIGYETYLASLFSNNIHLKDTGFFVKSFFEKYDSKEKNTILFQLNKLYSIYQLNHQSFDLFHATYFDPYFIPYVGKKPMVVTIFDMIYERLPDQFEHSVEYNRIVDQKRIIAEKANRIITISESTKKDIVTLLDIDPARIDVVYLANSLKPAISSQTNNQLKGIGDQSYLLYVGNRQGYKNFNGLLYAVHSLLITYQIKLICAGGGEFTQDEKKFINSLGVNELVDQRSIDNCSLIQLYQQAIIFVFPSLYEGFGLPILESFACQCPCICSDRGSMSEIADEAVLYINPSEPESIRAVVQKLIDDSELRKLLISKGKQRLKNFSWEKTISETLRVYEMAMS